VELVILPLNINTIDIKSRLIFDFS